MISIVLDSMNELSINVVEESDEEESEDTNKSGEGGNDMSIITEEEEPDDDGEESSTQGTGTTFPTRTFINQVKYRLVGEQAVAMREALNDEDDEDYTEEEQQSLAKTLAMAQVYI